MPLFIRGFFRSRKEEGFRVSKALKTEKRAFFVKHVEILDLMSVVRLRFVSCGCTLVVNHAEKAKTNL